MRLSRAGTRTSIYSQTSQPISDTDVPGGYPDESVSKDTTTQQTLAEAVHARRAEFCRPNTIRIKVGTWNVAGKKGTELDLAKWFVSGKGLDEALSGLSNTTLSQSFENDPPNLPTQDRKEGVTEQESRVATEQYEPTTPHHDHSEIPHGKDIGLYVLGLQEIVDISSATEALRPYTDPTTASKWKTKLEESLPHGFQLIAQQQLIGLMLFIYASPDVAPQISSVSVTSCGTGLMGYIGNKGAVTTRLVLGETTRLVFINSHLSSGAGKTELDRRNWDAAQIRSRTQYEPIEDSLGLNSTRREKLGEEDFAFWFGDLNYRLEGIPGDDVRKLLMLHTRNEYDINRQHADTNQDDSISTHSAEGGEPNNQSQASSKVSSTVSSPSKSSFDKSRSSTDSDRTSLEGIDDDDVDPSANPAHLQNTLNSLLPHDELHQQQQKRKAFHDGWQEGPITFLPTYKYDVGSVGVFDSGDKKRGPSWCDRILYRTRKDKADYENALLDEQEVTRKDKEYESKGMDEAAADQSMLYEYDPEADGDDAAQEAQEFTTGNDPIQLDTHSGYKDLIQLEYYVSHQRVLSSDHKPLDAVFRLEYDAVVPELKSKTHQEVARDLDRTENESRPAITLIPDSQMNGDGKSVEALDFGNLRYDESKTQTITLANTGRAQAFLGFLLQKRQDAPDMAVAPAWLQVSIEPPEEAGERGATKINKSKNVEDWAKDVPDIFSLAPGDTCTVKCTAHVRKISLVRTLNEEGAIDDVIIMRVKDGRDHFVPVHASWEPTVIGFSISDLIRCPEGGIRQLKAQLKETATNGKRSSAVLSSAPKELFRLTQVIENLSERILAEWSMVDLNKENEETPPWCKSSGWPFEGWMLPESDRHNLRTKIIEALDTTKSFEELVSVDTPPLHRLEAFAETFLIFLECLSDGIITTDLWTNLTTSFFSKDRSKTKPSRDDERASILEVLSASSPHSVSFVLITSMLGVLVQEVASNSQESQLKELPSSQKTLVRRKTLSSDPVVAHKQVVQKTYAAIFAEATVRSPEQTSAKAKAATLEQKKELIEIFLDNGIDNG